MVPFADQAYRKYMKETVQPWLAETVTQGYFLSYDGTKLNYYRALHDQSRGTIVIVHGFCEFFGKYHELFYNLYEAGYSVFFLEQRGHGFSAREIPEEDRVYVDDFIEYVRDLRGFMSKVVLPLEPVSRKILFGHSMGGCIAALFLETYPQYFDAAVLSSPMMRMSGGNMSRLQKHALYVVSRVLGWRTKAVRNETFDGTPDFEESGALSEARYAYQFQQRLETPEYRTFAPTYAWARAALRATEILQVRAPEIHVPVLILQAGRDTMVDNSGQDAFAGHCPGARIEVFPESKHEIFNADEAVLERYYRMLFAFLANRTEEGTGRRYGTAGSGTAPLRPVADAWVPFAAFGTTAEFARLDGGYFRHCGPTAVTNLASAWQNRFLPKAERKDAETLFRTAAEEGRKARLYVNTERAKGPGGTSDLLYPAYVRLCFHKFGFRDVKTQGPYPLSGRHLLAQLRRDRIAYVSFFRHPKYGNHHLVCYGAGLVRSRELGRTLVFCFADGWQNAPVVLTEEELGVGTFLAVYH